MDKNGRTHHILLKSKKHHNVCLEWHGYTPVNINKYFDMLNEIKPPNKRFLNEWYAEIQIPHRGDDDFILRRDGTINVSATRKARRHLQGRFL